MGHGEAMSTYDFLITYNTLYLYDAYNVEIPEKYLKPASRENDSDQGLNNILSVDTKCKMLIDTHAPHHSPYPQI